MIYTYTSLQILNSYWKHAVGTLVQQQCLIRRPLPIFLLLTVWLPMHNWVHSPQNTSKNTHIHSCIMVNAMNITIASPSKVDAHLCWAEYGHGQLVITPTATNRYNVYTRNEQGLRLIKETSFLYYRLSGGFVVCLGKNWRWGHYRQW